MLIECALLLVGQSTWSISLIGLSVSYYTHSWFSRWGLFGFFCLVWLVSALGHP